MIRWNSTGMAILNDGERQLLELHHKADAFPMTMHHGTVSYELEESWLEFWLKSSVDGRMHLLGSVDLDNN